MYASLDDLTKQVSEDLLIQLTDDNGIGSINTDVTDMALEAADVEIDGYLGGRYALPLATVPGIVTKQAVDITIYNLYSRRPGGPADHIQKRYDNAVRFLDRVARGDISLGMDDPEPTGDNSAEMVSGASIFSRETA